MAFSDELQQFKKFNRERRIQYSEESFAKGIKYVTSPLEAGYARNLVNFDLLDSGKSLGPRPGFRTFEVTQDIDLKEIYDENNLPKEKQIYYASENIEEDGNIYRQLLLGNVNVTKENRNKLIKTGSLNAYTIYPKENESTRAHAINENIEVLKQSITEYDPERYEFFFNSPAEAVIHGVALEDPSVIATHIGSELAAEGTKKYYCFRHDKETDKTELVFLTFNKETSKYEFEVLEPQATTAYNASLSMYNMLQEDPYTFKDTYEASALQFMGAYITDLEGKQRQATYINTEYKIKMNYAVAKGQKYKVVWEWKEPVSSNWTEITTQHYDFKDDEPPVMDVKWASPASAVIIRVQAFPYDDTREIIELLAFASGSEIPTPTAEGQKYYNVETRKIYTASKSGTSFIWGGASYPLTSNLYKRKDDSDTLYRWIGIEMAVTDMYDYVASQAMQINITFGEAMSEAAQNLDYTRYDLSTCKGMVTWGQRLCIYAPDKGLNMLFVSEPNNPAWFPFPRNISLFSENIIKCISYLDYLLVFTSNAVYQLTLAEGGDGWTEKCLQKNLNIQPADIGFIKLIKNMIFFKSNNYFYMVVPSSTSTTGLTIAPITTNIEMFLDNFQDAVEELMVEAYDNKTPYKLVHYKNHVNYKNVFNMYTFKSDRGMYFNLFLIYNTESRYWTSYIIESHSLVNSYKIDVANDDVYMAYTPLLVDGKISHSIQFLKFMEDRHDFYIMPYKSLDIDLEKYCAEHILFKNHQFIDTGYREHESDFKKRYRELQFKLNNYAQVDLKFYTQFMIDGYVRQDEADYLVQKVIDKEDPRNGIISYDRVYAEEAGFLVPGATTLGETPLLADDEGRYYVHNSEETIKDKLMWKLDVSEFPETVFWKTRFPVSGKGYVPRLKILNMDQEKYELLNISWVFRLLYSR
jgi:hypothetical protein